MYVCMHTMHVCLYTCIYVCMHVHRYICMHVCIHAWMYAYINTEELLERCHTQKNVVTHKRTLSHTKHVTSVTNFILLGKLFKNTNSSVLRYQCKASAGAKHQQQQHPQLQQPQSPLLTLSLLMLFSLLLGPWHFRGIWIRSCAGFQTSSIMSNGHKRGHMNRI